MSRYVLFVGLAVGALFMGSCSSSSDGEVIIPSNPDPACSDNTGNRFVDCGNGTITDTATGLIWLKNARCLGWHDWAEAKSSASALSDGQCGLTDNSSAGDWRLPTLGCSSEWWCSLLVASGEFASMFAPACGSSHFIMDTTGNGCWSEGDPFTNVSGSGYWSASSDQGAPQFAWFAALDTVRVISQDKLQDGLVWPVRGGN